MASIFSAWMADRLVDNEESNAVRIVGEVDYIVCRDFGFQMSPNILLLMRYVLSDWMTKKMDVFNSLRPGKLISVNGRLEVQPRPSRRLYFKSSEFIGPNLYVFELWKEPGYLWLDKLSISRVCDTSRLLPLPFDEMEVEEFNRVIALSSGFYQCVCITLTDGSYLNSLTLQRL